MKRLITFLISFCLVFEQTGFAQVALPLGIPGYASGLSAPEKLRPSHLRYLSYDPLNNKFRVLLDKGGKKDLKEEELRISAQDLFRFFLIGLTLPNDSFWVNLRPDSPQDIIDPDLAGTDIGRILLEADVQLKKDTARYTAPDTTEGKVYWARLHQKTSELFASRQIDLPTLTRPWIVPNEIILRASGGSVYIYKASLKVMLESDYLKSSAGYSFSDERLKILNEYSSSLIRELIIPKLSKDINTLPKYAGLRQVYYSLILAQWFKKQFKDDPGMAKVIDRKDLAGLASAEVWSKDTYFRRYQESFQKGEYNRQGYAQTPYGQTILQYFSGGIKINTERAVPPETYRKGFDPSLLPNTVMFEGAVSDGLKPKLTALIKDPGNAGAGEKNAERKWPDGGMISFSRDELKGYIADELDEPSVAGLKKSYENLYPDIPVYWEKNARIPVASIIPSKQSRIVLKELAARIMEFRQETKKNVVLWKDADVNGKIRNFIVDGHHRFAAAEIINRSTGVTGDKINFLSADVFDPLRKGRTSFSSIEPRPISEIKVLLPDGREVQLKELTLKEISNKDRITFELDTDGGKFSPGAGSFVFDYQKSVESFLRSFMEVRDPAANNGKARVFSYILPPGSPKQRKDAFRSRLDDFIDYLPVDINRQIVRPGLGVDFIIQELCKNAFDRLVSPESLSRARSADTLAIDVYFAVRAGVNQEKSLEISVEDTGAGKLAANAGDKRGYSMYLEDERSPYLSWTDDWGKFNQQVIDKVNGKIKGSLAAGYKETLADIPGEKSSAVFEIPLESLVLTGLKPPPGQGESDGGEITLKIYGKEYALPMEAVENIHLWSGSRYGRMDAVSKEAALSRDAEALWELYSLIWKNDLKTAGNIRADKIAQFKKLLAGESAELLWVFEPVPGQIKGYMTVTEKETYASITSGAVAEEYQRKKIGTALCLTMMGFMERKGVKRFETNTVGAGSQKIADSLGWEHDEDGGPFQYFFEPVLPVAGELVTDPAATGELTLVYNRIIGSKDTVGSGLMFNVYELPEYPHLVFKVLREKGEVFELAVDEEIWRMGEIVRELGAAKVSVDGFVLANVSRLAPFAYCRITDPAGNPALIVVQQKADTRIDDGEFDAFVRDWDQRLFWWDREKNNVGRINGEIVLIDFGGLEMAEYALQRIEAGASDAMSLLVEEIIKREKVPPDEFERMLKDGDSTIRMIGAAALEELSSEKARQAGKPGGSLLKDGGKGMTNPISPQLSLNDYRNNIQQAVERKEILIYTEQEDTFSALAGGLTGGNTRGLPEDTKVFFKKYFQANAWDPGGVDILVLGAGAGKECADIYGLARGNSLPINIDTVSLSPIDPRLLLKASSLEIRRMLYEYIQRSAMRSAELGPEELYRIRSLPQARSGIPWETVFELHNNGYPVCDYLDKPFIRRQYIVELNALDIDKKYGLIYDQIGGFWYSVKKDGIQKTIQTISRLLRREGLFYAENFPEPIDFSSAAIPEGFIGITSDVNDRLLLAGKGGRIDKLVSGILAASAREGDVYKTADFGRIFKIIGTAPPGGDTGADNDGGLRAYIANKDPGREVVDVDLWADEYIDPIVDAVKSDKAVALHLSNGAFTLGERGSKLANKLKFICIMLAREFNPVPDMDIQKSILEVMKNAFIHGNKTDMSVPIYLYLKLDDIGWMDALTVYNNTLDAQFTEMEKQLLLNSGWSGRNKGVNDLQRKFKYELLELPDIQACKVTITPGNKDQAEAGPDNDGGNKGGIDLRSLPVSAGRGLALIAGANPALADMDMAGEWRQIQNMVNSGFIPNIQRIRDYTAACCQKGLIQSEKEGILLCVADILRIEEDKNLDTDPGIKEFLAGVDQLS